MALGPRLYDALSPPSRGWLLSCEMMEYRGTESESDDILLGVGVDADDDGLRGGYSGTVEGDCARGSGIISSLTRDRV